MVAFRSSIGWPNAQSRKLDVKFKLKFNFKSKFKLHRKCGGPENLGAARHSSTCRSSVRSILYNLFNTKELLDGSLLFYNRGSIRSYYAPYWQPIQHAAILHTLQYSTRRFSRALDPTQPVMCRNGLCWIGDVRSRLGCCAELPRAESVASVEHISVV